MFAIKATGISKMLHFKVKYLAHPQTLDLPGTNTLAYYKHLQITDVKGFIELAPDLHLHKHFQPTFQLAHNVLLCLQALFLRHVVVAAVLVVSPAADPAAVVLVVYPVAAVPVVAVAVSPADAAVLFAVLAVSPDGTVPAVVDFPSDPSVFVAGLVGAALFHAISTVLAVSPAADPAVVVLAVYLIAAVSLAAAVPVVAVAVSPTDAAVHAVPTVFVVSVVAVPVVLAPVLAFSPAALLAGDSPVAALPLADAVDIFWALLALALVALSAVVFVAVLAGVYHAPVYPLADVVVHQDALVLVSLTAVEAFAVAVVHA